MSRPPRAGSPGRPVTVRATDAERAKWQRTAAAERCPNLSAWIVRALNERSDRRAAGDA